MTEIINAKKGKKKSTARFVVHIVVISLLTASVITGSVLSLLYSTLDYIPNLIINIVVDVLYFTFLVFYFFTFFPIVKYYYKLFKGMNDFTLERRRKMTFVEEKEEKTISNVRFRVFSFSYKEGETIYLENLYVLDNDVVFEANKDYSLQTYQNIIVRYQEITHASI